MTIETKFAPGDEVWMMESNQARSFYIETVNAGCSLNYLDGTANKPEVSYKLRGRADPWHSDVCLFPTKAELLASL